MKSIKYSLGLDIGTSSVGWSIINENEQRIEDTGVLIFEKPEEPKTGKSLSEARRSARGSRRRLSRRRVRLNQLKKFFISEKLLTRDEISRILTAENLANYNEFDPWEIRVRALDEKISSEELFRALYHIAKRRGYKSNRKSAKDEESGKVLGGISENSRLLMKNGGKYRTIGEAIFSDKKFSLQKRNKRDSYDNSFYRTDFEDEFRKILRAQDFSDEKIQKIFDGEQRDFYEDRVFATGVFAQRPFTNKFLIDRMRGDGEFGGERAPKASASFEIFRAAQELKNLVLIDENDQKNSRKLTPDEIAKIINSGILKEKVSYENIRKFADLDENFAFNYLREKTLDMKNFDTKNKDEKLAKNAQKLNADYQKKFAKTMVSPKRFLRDLNEKNTLYENKFLASIVKTLDGKDVDIFTKILNIEKYENKDFCESLEKLDEVGEILTVWNTDEKIHEHLMPIFSETTIENILVKGLNFSGFCNLSFESLRKITPFILAGNTYDKAVEMAGYEFHITKNREKFIRNLNKNEEQEITNPVVKRAIRQTIEVVNAVVKKYGSPYYVKIEAARELAKNFDDRQKIEKTYKDNFARNEEIKSDIEAMGVANPNGQDIVKYKLWKSQYGKSVYSDTEIERERLFEPGYVEIDHIIPFSRCGNDGFDNKALVLSLENQLKRNQTLFEWKGKSAEWDSIKARINSLNISERKKRNLLAEDISLADAKNAWNQRALNDTRFISRFLREFFDNNLEFSPLDDDDKKRVNANKSGEIQRVIMPTGAITSYLRKRWGLSKVREENNLHHAQDAAVIAAIDQGTICAAAMEDKLHNELSGRLLTEKFLKKAEEQIENSGEIDLETRTNKRTGEIFTQDEYLSYLKNKIQKSQKRDIFPQPYDDFREEVQGRVMDIENEENGAEHFAQWAKNFYLDDDFSRKIHPIFTSRFRKKKTSGATNQDTVRSPKIWEEIDGKMEKTDNKKAKNPRRLQRKNVENLTIEDLKNSPIAQDDLQVYETLRKYVETRDELAKIKPKTDEEKADFAKKIEENLPWKFTKNGDKVSRIKNIKIWTETSKSKSGFYINGEKAFVNNGVMVRIDLYKWRGKGQPPRKIYYKAMPVYTYEISRIEKPDLIFKSLDGGEDKNYAFEMEIWKNDYLEMVFDDRAVQGYYNGYGITNTQFTLTQHKSPNVGERWNKDKQRYDSFVQTPGKARMIRKIGINILGDNFPSSFYKRSK